VEEEGQSKRNKRSKGEERREEKEKVQLGLGQGEDDLPEEEGGGAEEDLLRDEMLKEEDDLDALLPAKRSEEAFEEEQRGRVFTQSSFRFGLSVGEGVEAEEKEEEEVGSSFRDEAEEGAAATGLSREALMKIRAAVQSYSLQLCEQLRLLLAPTLCTRLQGDYRSGKRINMRKVISYVSSGFRKDKIWLRRTKPAKREYQVMVMVDDSSSMGSAGPLALAAVSTITTALSRLELADSLCIASFSDRVRVLHAFGTMLTDEGELGALGEFSFAAERTLLGASLQAAIPLFQAAKLGLSGSEDEGTVLQICFVISDAKIDSDNRAVLDRIVHDMSEQHILVVLIIIDSHADRKDSIFNTRTVSFRGDKVVTQSYLEDFPFPYYVAIQHVHALPEVLSDALKQWFELIRGQMGRAA
jgi:midasin